MIINYNNVPKNYENRITNVIEQTLKFLNQTLDIEASVSFVSGDEIEMLNKENRNVDKVTDVLSFPSLDINAGQKITDVRNDFSEMTKGFVYLGDIVICLDVAKAQAVEYNNTIENEILRLTLHSVLHLLGYDHILDNDYLLMHENEEHLLNLLKIKTNV